MQSNLKAYLVVEYGEEGEDSWENVIAACETPEIADTIKNSRLEERENSKCKISESEWIDMNTELNMSETWDDYFEGLHELFPQYSIEDLELASQVYDSGFEGICIQEVDYYGN